MGINISCIEFYVFKVNLGGNKIVLTLLSEGVTFLSIYFALYSLAFCDASTLAANLTTADEPETFC